MKKEQGHGDHIGAIMEPQEFLDHHLTRLIDSGKLKNRCRTQAVSDTVNGEETEVITIVNDSEDIQWEILFVKGKEQYELVSAFPLLQPAETVKAKITGVGEWENMIEATIFCEIDCDNEDMDGCQLQFFATDYAWNKQRYVVGNYLFIDLAAIAYNVREGQKGFSFDGQKAIDFLAKTGREPDYDENGNVQPVHFSLEHLVAFLTHNEDYPDNVEFQSPISNITPVNAIDVDLYRCEMLFKHDPDRKLALYFRREFIPAPQDGMPLAGVLWLQGHISDTRQ